MGAGAEGCDDISWRGSLAGSRQHRPGLLGDTGRSAVWYSDLVYSVSVVYNKIPKALQPAMANGWFLIVCLFLWRRVSGQERLHQAGLAQGVSCAYGQASGWGFSTEAEGAHSNPGPVPWALISPGPLLMPSHLPLLPRIRAAEMARLV